MHVLDGREAPGKFSLLYIRFPVLGFEIPVSPKDVGEGFSNEQTGSPLGREIAVQCTDMEDPFNRFSCFGLFDTFST